MPRSDPDGLVERLRAAARSGHLLDLAPQIADADLDPAQGADWPAERRVPADVVRTVLLDTHLAPDPHGLRLRGALITGTLDLDHSTLPCPLMLRGCHFQRPLTLEDATLPELDLRGSHVPELSLDGARLVGGAFLAELTATGMVRAFGARIGGRLELSGATLTNPGGHALNLDGAHLEGPAFLGGLTATGEVRGLDAEISGPLVLSGAKLTNEGGHALNLDRARLAAGAFLEGLTAIGGVRALDARVDGPLNLSGATLTNAGGDALNLDRARLAASASLAGLTATGEVRALSARIGGQLDLSGATLTNEGGDALSLDGARVEASTFLWGLTATGAVRADGAGIGGQLGLSGATLTNEGGNALSLDGARVEGGAFLGRLTATGEVRALGVQIGGELDLSGATLTNQGGDALSLDGARVEADAFLARLTATGMVRIVGARIAGQLVLSGATLTNDGAAVLAERLEVRELRFRGINSVRGALRLTRARIGNLVVDEAPNDDGLAAPLVASGWNVEDLHGTMRHDRRAAAAWLATQPEFVAQPWHALADVYERNGQPADARVLRFRAAHRTTRNAPRLTKAPRWAYGLLVGYGYYPLAAGGWLVAALAAAWLAIATHAQTFVPTHPVRAARVAPVARVTGTTSCAALGDRYPCLRPLQYSLDVVLPTNIATGQAQSWRPDATWMVYLLTTLKAFGWLLTALLVAGVTGLLRKT